MLRRNYLLASASGICGRKLYSENKDQQEDADLEIGIYVTKAAEEQYGKSIAKNLSNVIKSSYQDALPDSTLDVSFKEAIEASQEDKDSARSSANWWLGRGECKDSNLLIYSYDETDWDRYSGYGFYYKPYSVLAGYLGTKVDRKQKHMAIHETGHNFGLKHNDHTSNEKLSVMDPNPHESDKPVSLEFSEESVKQIKSRL